MQQTGGGSQPGRDHHKDAFTRLLAGGGVKQGITHGRTDEFGYNIVEKPVHVHDLNATMLPLLDLDHERRARELCAGVKSGDIVLFDKGYVDFDHRQDLDRRGAFWVTRGSDARRRNSGSKMSLPTRPNLFSCTECNSRKYFLLRV